MVGQDDFQEDQIYFWDTKKNLWEDQSLIQTALYCCTALYERAPHKYLVRSENKKNHDVVDVKFVGNYHPSPKAEDYTRFLIAEDSERNMFIAFRGSTTLEDWTQNANIGLSTDIAFGTGSFHGGFLNKVNNINFENLIEMIKVVEPKAIVTAGHSQGGSVSSLMYLKLLERCSSQHEQPQLLNFTFGAPMIGNRIAACSTREKGWETNMFHFINPADVVPAVLSIGHVFKTLEANIPIINDIADWARKNNTALKIVENCVCALVKSLFDHKKWKQFSDFKKNYEQLKKGIQKTSTLFTYYSDFEYAPIGNYIFFQKQQNGMYEFRKLEHPDSKLVERILQSSIEHNVDQFNLDQHNIGTYQKMFFDALKGFKYFEKDRKMKLFNAHSMYLDGFQLECGRFKEDNVAVHHCGHSKCTINKETPLHLQDDGEVKPKIGQCISCRDIGELECFFHEKCASVHEKENGHQFDYFDIIGVDKGNRNGLLAKKLNFMAQPYDTKQSNALTNFAFLTKNSVGALRISKTLVNYAIEYIPSNLPGLTEASENAIIGIQEGFGADIAGIGLTVGFELVIFGYQTFNHIRELNSSQITWSEFWEKETRGLSRCITISVGAFVGMNIGAAIGAALGSAIPVAGNFIGGIIGVALSWVAGKALELVSGYFLDGIFGTKAKDEIEEKAIFFVQAMLVLETLDITEINEKHVNQCFRKKALTSHPDKWPKNLKEDEKKQKALIWYAIESSRTVLLVYCIDKNMSPMVMKRVQELYQKAVEDKHKQTDIALAKAMSQSKIITETSGALE